MSTKTAPPSQTPKDAEVADQQDLANSSVKRKFFDYVAPRMMPTLALTVLIIMFWLFLDIFSAEKIVALFLLSAQFKIIYVILVAMLLYYIWVLGRYEDKNSFVYLDEQKKVERHRANLFKNGIFSDASVDRAKATASTALAISNKLSAVSGYDFVVHMKSIVESLDYQIDYAEAKASRLLEVGRGFVKGGIVLYVVSIVIWQAYLYYIHFAMSAGVILGMVSTTAIFLIMEFLGAWYLKQYRHYGDSAFSYMKVRSSYNKYMLAYCTIVEFSDEKRCKSKEDMLRVLAEKDNWPELKDVNSNDFNYMIQSIESLGVMFEKLKGVFSRGSTQAKPDSV